MRLCRFLMLITVDHSNDCLSYHLVYQNDCLILAINHSNDCLTLAINHSNDCLLSAVNHSNDCLSINLIDQAAPGNGLESAGSPSIHRRFEPGNKPDNHPDNQESHFLIGRLSYNPKSPYTSQSHAIPPPNKKRQSYSTFC